MITRILVYGILICLTIATAYVRLNRNTSSEKETVIEKINVGPSQPASKPSSSVADRTAAPVEIPLLQANSVERDDMAREDIERAKSGIAKMREGDYAGAARIFSELSERNKDALSAAGLSYLRLGDYEKALSFLEKAAQHNNGDFVTRKALAFAYYKTNDLAKSLENAGAALSSKTDAELETLKVRLAKDMQAQRSYNEESSSHFRVFFDGYAHGNINREITGILEDAYRAIGKELDYFPSDTIPVILYADKDFFDTTQAPSWTSGYYDGKIRIPIRGSDKHSALLKKVLFHEYTHAVVRSITKGCPVWINEGLAEYFSGSYPGKIGQAIPLRNLENSFLGLSGSNARTAYLESYSAVSFLIEKYGVHRVKELLLAMSNGNDLNRAFADAFGITYDEFVVKWN